MTNALFICEVCKNVYLDTCPTCPDRGNGPGFGVQQIKDAIRAAPTVADINDTARHFGWHVERLKREGGAARTMAIQIQNLAAYRRQQIQETEWADRTGS